MSIYEVLGYMAAVVAGLVIGMAGGGGSILTVPILVYLFHIPPVLATTYSLFVVAVSSLVGSIGYAFRMQINVAVTAAFALPSFASVYVTRRFLVPALPEPLCRLGSFELSKNEATIYFFAFIMLIAARAMIRHKSVKKDKLAKRPRLGLLALDGLAVGMLTGTIGAGGGFLIVPMLVLLAGLSMRKAVGTSVLIITINSGIGFLSDSHRADLNWHFLVNFTAFSVFGIAVGLYLTRFVPPERLKRGFGWFVLVIACYMIIQEILAE